MRASRQQSELIREYAKSKGFAVRTAQEHRRKNDPRWREWCDNRLAGRIVNAAEREKAKTAMDAASQPVEGEEMPPGLLPEEEMEIRAKRNVDNIEKLLKTAIGSGDSIEISSLIKSQEMALKCWKLSKDSADSARLDAGKYIRAEDLTRFEKSMEALKSVMDQMPNELGPKSNPADKPFAIKAAAEWLRGRFRGNYEAALKELGVLGA